MSKPECLVTGEMARLLPVVPETHKEQRATSILLATLSVVPALTSEVLGVIGKKVGARSTIDAYTEVVFTNGLEKSVFRPDGLLVIDQGKPKEWKALIESKIGRTPLEEDQIRSYLAVAKANGVDAVITISNQFAALPTHHPIKVPKSAIKAVNLYHWSWMFLLTQSILFLKNSNEATGDQKFILSEVVRYLEHDKTGVSSFDRMAPEWRDLVTQVQSGAQLKKNCAEVTACIGSWHQEERDLCLIMSRKIACPVSVRLSRLHIGDPIKRVADDIDKLVKNSILECSLEVPDAAAHLDVKADLKRRSISCAMRLSAPKDKVHAPARINWLLRQISHVDPSDVFVRAQWPGRIQDTLVPLADVRADLKLLMPENGKSAPIAMEVL
ncbi:MAG: hypothetical protein KDA47_02140, partial [Planctomycetales bacterium]|nr:hypothetical protein [Planctomycetales bacterium]